MKITIELSPGYAYHGTEASNVTVHYSNVAELLFDKPFLKINLKDGGQIAVRTDDVVSYTLSKEDKA